MGRTKSPQLPNNAREYGESDWLVYGLTGTPNTREKLIALTIEHMVKFGPSAFEAKQVCDRIDAKHALVNYYFGNKEMLIAEASATTYKKHILEILDVVENAPRDPLKRFKALLVEDLKWHKRMKSWAVLVSYPILSDNSRSLIEENFGDSLRHHFEYLTAITARLVRDIREGQVTELNFEIGNLPMHEIARHPAIVLDAISILYSAHGLNIWAAGSQVGSASLSSNEITQKIAIDHHIKRMLDLAKGI